MGVINQRGIIDSFSTLFDFSNDPASLPSSVNKGIQATIDINPLAYPTATIVKSTTSTAATIYTTLSTSDFYITQIVMAATMGTSGLNAVQGIVNINATVSATSTILASLSCSAGPVTSPDGGSTLLAQTGSTTISISFPSPIKIDRNTNITTSLSGNGMSNFSGVIQGFYFNSQAIGLTAQNY